MRKFLLIFSVSLFVLAGCGSDNDADKTPVVSKNSQIFETSEFSIIFPQGFEVIAPKDFTSDIPVGTLVGFRSPQRNDVFTTNLSLIKTDIPEAVSSLDYAKGLLQKQNNSLLDFKELARTEIEVTVGSQADKTFLANFEGKERADADVKEFFQVVVTEEKTAYMATAAFLKNEDEGVKQELEASLKSFSIK